MLQQMELTELLFFSKIDEVLNDLEAESFLFVGGDFNCTVDDKLDRNH